MLRRRQLARCNTLCHNRHNESARRNTYNGDPIDGGQARPHYGAGESLFCRWRRFQPNLLCRTGFNAVGMKWRAKSNLEWANRRPSCQIIVWDGRGAAPELVLMTSLIWPELYFIRHGETPWNAEKRYQGRQDIPLNEKGRGQADQNGVALAALFAARGLDPMAFDWYASPLSRTRETMDRVRAGFSAALPPVQYDARLMEISFGALEGKLFADLPANMAHAPGRRTKSYWEFRPENGENYPDLEGRLKQFAATMNGPSIVVAHGGVARALRVLIEHAPILEVINWAPPQDVIMHFTQGKMELLPAQ